MEPREGWKTASYQSWSPVEASGLTLPFLLSRGSGLPRRKPVSSGGAGRAPLGASSSAITFNQHLMRMEVALAYLWCRAATTHKPQLLRHLKINLKQNVQVTELKGLEGPGREHRPRLSHRCNWSRQLL